jgi:hypothetical protein
MDIPIKFPSFIKKIIGFLNQISPFLRVWLGWMLASPRVIVHFAANKALQAILAAVKLYLYLHIIIF